MTIRLNKLLAQRGLGARRKCDELIQSGEVRVNGVVVTEPGTQVEPGRDRVLVRGRPLPALPELKYYVINKPVGIITTLDDPEGRRTIREFLPAGTRLFPVGRLDADTSGLLVLTNDGDLAHHLMHPRYGVEKIYRVRLDHMPDARQIGALRNGVQFEPGVTSAPARARVLSSDGPGAMIEIALHEGRYRQVRRMCEALGLTVTGLHRSAYGPLRLGPLARGMWRELSEVEVERLRAASARPRLRGLPPGKYFGARARRDAAAARPERAAGARATRTTGAPPPETVTRSPRDLGFYPPRDAVDRPARSGARPPRAAGTRVPGGAASRPRRGPGSRPSREGGTRAPRERSDSFRPDARDFGARPPRDAGARAPRETGGRAPRGAEARAPRERSDSFSRTGAPPPRRREGSVRNEAPRPSRAPRDAGRRPAEGAGRPPAEGRPGSFRARRGPGDTRDRTRPTPRTPWKKSRPGDDRERRIPGEPPRTPGRGRPADRAGSARDGGARSTGWKPAGRSARPERSGASERPFSGFMRPTGDGPRTDHYSRSPGRGSRGPGGPSASRGPEGPRPARGPGGPRAERGSRPPGRASRGPGGPRPGGPRDSRGPSGPRARTGGRFGTPRTSSSDPSRRPGENPRRPERGRPGSAPKRGKRPRSG